MGVFLFICEFTWCESLNVYIHAIYQGLFEEILEYNIVRTLRIITAALYTGSENLNKVEELLLQVQYV